jgi:AmiR/NasT family two-component response regulator
MHPSLNMEAYLQGRLQNYKEQLHNAQVLEDPDEILMAESVIEELNHLLTIVSMHYNRV